jgi:hypothetical protein
MRTVFLSLAALVFAALVQAQAPSGNASAPANAEGGAPAPASTQTPLGQRNMATQRTPARPVGASPKGGRYKQDIPVSTPIITLDGVCAQASAAAPATKPSATKASSSAPCKTVVTRGQLDALLDAIDPNASPKARQQFAITYARLLVATQISEQKHLDQRPEVLRSIQVQQKLGRMEVLSDALLEKLQKDAAHVPTKDVEAYYRQYASTFEGAHVQRLVIPIGAATESGKPVEEAAAKAKMTELRARAIEGDEFDDLQGRAYKELGIKGNVPPTEISVMRRNGLSPEELKIFDMDAGETTPVIEADNVVLILRVISRRTQSLSEAQSQIEAVLLQQRLQEQLRDATQGINADFNLKYLEAKTQPELFPNTMVGFGALRRGMLSSMHIQP